MVVDVVAICVEPFVLVDGEDAIAADRAALFDQRNVVLGHSNLRRILEVLLLDLLVGLAQLDLIDERNMRPERRNTRHHFRHDLLTYLSFEELAVDFATGDEPWRHVLQALVRSRLLLLLLLLLELLLLLLR